MALDASDIPDPVAACPPPATFSPEDDRDFWDDPEADFWDMHLDSETYSAMLTDYARTGDWQGAVGLLQEMRSIGMPADLDGYKAALCACRDAAEGQRALDLVGEMWQRELDPDVASYSAAISACTRAQKAELAAELLKELRQWGVSPHAERFHLVPRLSWNRDVRKMGCSIRNTMPWNGLGPLPRAPPRPCWLIPTQDDAALHIAEQQAQLRAMGWKVLSSSPAIVAQLRDKAKLRRLAERLGLSELLPTHFDSPDSARYPCILKPAVGTWGKDTHIARAGEDVRHVAPLGLGTRWVLQELIPGHLEYSTSLLVVRGEILDAVCIRYEYNLEEYVWPHVQEVGNVECSFPAEHLDCMRPFLDGYSGICNFNYKLREGGRMCIFEVNPRVGGDLAFDVPRPRARALFEKLDAMFP